MRRIVLASLASLVLLAASTPTQAQFDGRGAHDEFRDTTVLRPPDGAKVALIVFEDLGCPACARAHPYELKAIEETHATLLRYDFPLEAHVWTFEGAVVARYIQDKVSAQLAEQFRSEVFAAQELISNKDDLHQFAGDWLKKHGKQMPAEVDPGGALAKEVQADLELGKRLNVQLTPTVVVVTRNQYQVVCGTKTGANDPTQILQVLKAAIAQAGQVSK